MMIRTGFLNAKKIAIHSYAYTCLQASNKSPSIKRGNFRYLSINGNKRFLDRFIEAIKRKKPQIFNLIIYLREDYNFYSISKNGDTIEKILLNNIHNLKPNKREIELNNLTIDFLCAANFNIK